MSATTAIIERPSASTDAERRRGLRRMRVLATGLLVLAAIVYAVTLPLGGGWDYLHAAAEASMVGAIADWFAVTALFRHPLGLPIPHTALIPNRKVALAQSLQTFVTENFLSEDVVRAKFHDADPVRRLGVWLSDTAHAHRAVDEIATITRALLARIDDAEVASLIETELLPRLSDEPWSPIAGRLLQDVVAEDAHRGLVDLAATELHRWLVENPDRVEALLSTRAPWWTPQWLDEQVSGRIHLEVVRWVKEIRDDPDHRVRRTLDDALRQLATDLQNDPETMARAEQLKQRVLSSPQVVTAATSMWTALRRALSETLAEPESPLRVRSVRRLKTLGQDLAGDTPVHARMSSYGADLVAFVVNRYGDELATVITDTVAGWDGGEAARRIELHVGRDLQFIRINGTLVGALAGLVIFALTQLA